MKKTAQGLAAVFLLLGLLSPSGPTLLLPPTANSSLLAGAPTSPSSQALPEGVSSDWWGTAQEDLRQSEYHIHWQDHTYLPDLASAYQAPNRAHNLRTYFTPDGIRVIPRAAAAPEWEWGLALTAVGAGDDIQPVAPASLSPSDNRIEYRRGELTEWYLNDEHGLKQGFTLTSPPPSTSSTSSSEILIELGLSGSLAPSLVEGGQAIEFTTPGGVRVLRYADLRVSDAAGRALPAHFTLNPPSALRIFVDAAAAIYPITIDPLATLPSWSAESDQAGAQFGLSVSTAGDVNGDGYSDVLVGARYYDNGQTDEGRAYVYYGSATGLSTTPNWTAESDQAGSNFGIGNTAGDVNGDGYGDIVVAAYLYDNGQTDEGAAFVWSGSAAGLGVNGTPSNADWTAESNQTGGELGNSVSPAGDVNGDGYGDIIVGAYQYDNGQADEGVAFVWYGSATGLGANGTPANAGWMAEGNQIDDRFGSVGTAGDVNGDGYADVIIGAYFYDNGQTDEGAAFVWYGSATGLGANGAPSNADWMAESNQVIGPGIASDFGSVVGTAGDVNGDGYADIVIGASDYDQGQTDEGAAFVYYGSATGLGPNGTPANADWIAEGNQATAHFGVWASTAGDVNGDGYADVIIGAREYDNGQTDEGRAYVYYGSAAGLSLTPAWTGESDQAGAWYGNWAGTAGDVNGDGYADIIVGAQFYDNGETDEGRAFVYYGSPGGVSQTPGWTAESNQFSARFGNAVSTARDVNGDGYADVLVGAYFYDSGEVDEGAIFVYYGSATGLSLSPNWSAESNQTGAYLGDSVSTAGDVNGDGYTDILAAAYFYDNGETNEGVIFAWYGSASGLGANGTPGNADWMAESNQANAYLGLVGSAGDVNGDGYSDVISGARGYDNGQTDEGVVFVWYGSAIGLGTNGTPANAGWMAESNQASANFGDPANEAGDVNGDGYSDIIIGSFQYDNGQVDEGAAFVWYGSANGLGASGNPSNAGWSAEGGQAGAFFGGNVGAAGDVNGDGYADVIIGASNYDNSETNEGMAFIYYGSAAGLGAQGTPTNADWRAESNQANAWFGYALGTAGDVNGDGYADVIIGARYYDNGQSDEGRTFVYYGSATGPSVFSNWTAEGDLANASFGNAVSTAGDVNGDGYADILIGATHYSGGQTDEGRAYLYYGNDGLGLSLVPRQRRSDDSAPIAHLGQSDSATAIRLALLGRTPFGRGKVKLEWEIKPLGTLFDGAGAQQSAAWMDTGTAGAALDELIGGLSAGTVYHWRVRLRYHPASTPFQQYSRWLTIPWNGWQEARLRTPGAPPTQCTPEYNESDIVLVVDRSSSMNADNKLADAKAAVTTFITATTAPPDQLALVSFASAASLDQPLTTDKPALIAATQALTTSGGTRIDLGLQTARQELASSRHLSTHRKVIVLLSDGQQSGGDNSSVLAQANAAKAEGSILFTIGLGPDADAALLQQVASRPEYYYFAPTGQQLEDIYLRIRIALACLDVGGQVFVDQDADGVYDPGGDTPLANITLRLAGPVISQTVSGLQANGNYRFPANPAGTYTVTLDLSSVPAGYAPTTVISYVVTLSLRDDLDDDFGLRPPPATPTPTATSTPLPTLTPTPSSTPTPTPPPACLAGPWVYRNDFAGSVGAEWSPNPTSTTPTQRRFLGEFTNQTVGFILTGLPVHVEVMLCFDLFVIRSWDGNTVTNATGGWVGPDVWEASVLGGATLLRTTFTNWPEYRQAYPGAYPGGDYAAHSLATEIRTLGYDFKGVPMDAVYRVHLTFAHTASYVVLNFSASGLQPLADESWGLGNVEVKAVTQTYPVYLPLVVK